MRFGVLFGCLVCVIGVAVALPSVERKEAELSPNFDVELNPLKVLRQILKWCEDNNIKWSDILDSDFFNSDFFNSDFFNSDYFNSDFFNSELFNSEIFNRNNFLKLTTALFGLDGVHKEGTFNAEVAQILQGFFEAKDWEGLKNYLNSLPDPK